MLYKVNLETRERKEWMGAELTYSKGDSGVSLHFDAVGNHLFGRIVTGVRIIVLALI